MQPSSGTRAWRRWPCAAAIAVFLAVPTAYASGGGSSNQCEPIEQHEDDTQPTSGQKTNPCNGDEILFQGTRRTKTKDRVHRNCSVDSFQMLRTDAKGQGAFASYKIFEEFQDQFRFGPRRPTITIHREDERIIALKATLMGQVEDAAASFFHTLRTKTETSADGRRTRRHEEERTRCKRDDNHDD